MKTGILKRYCYMMYFYLKKKKSLFSLKNLYNSIAAAFQQNLHVLLQQKFLPSRV